MIQSEWIAKKEAFRAVKERRAILLRKFDGILDEPFSRYLRRYVEMICGALDGNRIVLPLHRSIDHIEVSFGIGSFQEVKRLKENGQPVNFLAEWREKVEDPEQ